MLKIGDKVKIKTYKKHLESAGYADTKEVVDTEIIEGIVTDVFDSANGEFKCFYIKDSVWLYTDKQLA